MKLSVSLPDEDVAFLDEFVKEHNIKSRSTALQRAIRLLRASQLTSDYAAAFAEWDDGDDWDHGDWDHTVGDGLGGAT